MISSMKNSKNVYQCVYVCALRLKSVDVLDAAYIKLPPPRAYNFDLNRVAYIRKSKCNRSNSTHSPIYTAKNARIRYT